MRLPPLAFSRIHLAATVPSASRTQATLPSPQPRPAVTPTLTALLRGQPGSAAPSAIENSGDLTVTATATVIGAEAYGITARTDGPGSTIGIQNSGDIVAISILTV